MPSNGRSPASASGAEYKEIPLDSVKVPEQPLRAIHDGCALAELTRSIAARGVLQPIIVRESEQGFVLVAGLRRCLAAKVAGLVLIPALVVERSESWASWATMAENRLREAINPLDEAIWLDHKLSDEGIQQSELALELGVSEGWVSQRVGLLRWPPEVRTAVGEGWLPFSVARELAGIHDRRSRAVALRFARLSGCTVRQAAEWRRKAEGEAELGGSADGLGVHGEPPRGGRPAQEFCLVCKQETAPRDGRYIMVCHTCELACGYEAESSGEAQQP